VPEPEDGERPPSIQLEIQEKSTGNVLPSTRALSATRTPCVTHKLPPCQVELEEARSKLELETKLKKSQHDARVKVSGRIKSSSQIVCQSCQFSTLEV
jgi:hypothetical protein